MNAVCFVFDRLHAGYVGAYGNSWINTPALDRLAGRSFLFDQAVIDTPDLDRLYRSYWQGRHAMCAAATHEASVKRDSPIFAETKIGTVPDSQPALAALLRHASVKTALFTDDPKISRNPLAGDFDERIELEPPGRPQTASAMEQTHFARCFMRIIDWLDTAREPFLLWCHLGGLGTTWDAPLDFRRAYVEEGDPPPPESADVPNRVLPPDYDPDELLGITQAYAGQIALLDTCFDAFLDFFDASPFSRNTLLTLTSSRGFPLGEHGRVGSCGELLFGEMVQVPWMLQLPDGVGAAARSQALVEPSDLWATLLDAWRIADAPRSPTGRSVLPLIRQEADALRDRVCVADAAGRRAVRTAAWYLRSNNNDDGNGGEEPELYTKPDDRWEVNNVVSRCREIAENLQNVLTDYEQAILSGRVSDLTPLDETLRSGLK